MAAVKIWVHDVWGTKNRDPILNTACRPLIFDHIRENALTKGFYVAEVNGYVDHIHCLIPLKPDWSIAKHMQMIKGESANWINKKGILQCRLEWADEYFAASVSEDKLGYVRNYIRNQEEHHRKISFTEEYNYFLKIFGFNQG
jgi:putative transposase